MFTGTYILSSSYRLSFVFLDNQSHIHVLSVMFVYLPFGVFLSFFFAVARLCFTEVTHKFHDYFWWLRT